MACARASSAPPGPAPAAGPAAFPRLVATDTLARWQADRQVVVLDVRTDVFTYLQGHLPGAEYLNTETVRASEGGIPTRRPPGGVEFGLPRAAQERPSEEKARPGPAAGVGQR